jgi:peptidoglycan-associated lipoprotein
MTPFGKLIAIGALCATAACTDASRFGDGAGDTVTNSGLNSGAGIIPGSANDPTSAAYFQASVGDRVLFQVDKHLLTPEGRQTLTAQAKWLMTNTEYTAIIEGHADEQGTREYNLGLGARRATEAREFLISQGVAANRLKTVSYGKERPIEICSEEACYAKNRRAVTVLAGGLTG